MVWSRVSKAADMSRAVRIVIRPESIFQSQFFQSRFHETSGLQWAETERYGNLRKKTS